MNPFRGAAVETVEEEEDVKEAGQYWASPKFLDDRAVNRPCQRLCISRIGFLPNAYRNKIEIIRSALIDEEPHYDTARASSIILILFIGVNAPSSSSSRPF